MHINITGRHVEITEGLKTAVNNQMNKLLKHYPDIESMSVILTVEKKEQVAEGIVHFLGQDLVAAASTQDLYVAINDLKTKLESLLQRRKATIKSHPHIKPDNVDAEEITAEEALNP
jgi:putative sigma-54 modulation protein